MGGGADSMGPLIAYLEEMAAGLEAQSGEEETEIRGKIAADDAFGKAYPNSSVNTVNPAVTTIICEFGFHVTKFHFEVVLELRIFSV